MIKKTQMLDQGPGPGIAAGHMVPTRPVGQVRAQADRVGHREPIPTWNRFKNYDSIGIVSLLESFWKDLVSNLIMGSKFNMRKFWFP